MFFFLIYFSDSHLRRVFVKIAQDAMVTKQWKVLAKQIGLTPEEISQAEEDAETGPDRCLHALRHWHLKMGNKATKTVLLKHLRMCRFTQTVSKSLSRLGRQEKLI